MTIVKRKGLVCYIKSKGYSQNEAYFKELISEHFKLMFTLLCKKKHKVLNTLQLILYEKKSPKVGYQIININFRFVKYF